MGNNRSWHGDAALKEVVLTQMQTHQGKAALDDLQVGDSQLNIYNWPNPINFPHCALTLGIEESVLHLGAYLFDGFPEDKAGIRDLIQSRMEMFEQIPVGVDLRQVCAEFILWRLEEADFGITAATFDQPVTALLIEIIAAFYQEAPDMQIIQQGIQKGENETNTQIAVQWQKHKTVDPNLYRQANAWKVLSAASQAFTDPASAADTAKAYLHAITNGGNRRDADQEYALMSGRFIQLLQAAPTSQ